MRGTRRGTATRPVQCQDAARRTEWGIMARQPWTETGGDVTDTDEIRTVDLSTLAGGAAAELFASAMNAVLENMDDPNTDCKTPRRIALTFTFKPDEDRRASAVEVGCTTKLAGVRGVPTRIFIGRHRGSLAAVEALRQEEMFPTPAGRPNAVVITGAEIINDASNASNAPDAPNTPVGAAAE